MCGILGGNDKNWNYKEALETIKHRGPDAQKIMPICDMVFGFARLSIIDLHENAMQPMLSADGRYAIVFNGEIYDFKKVRKQLEEKGYAFRTNSDTEVLLHAFIEWKEHMTDYLDGIFAIAIYDTLEERVWLFRDRCGIKPLYYFYDGTGFAFASELKAIVKLCNNVYFELDNTALYDYHNYLYIPEPKTMYKSVYKLEAASYIIFDVKTKKLSGVRRYWEVNVNTHEGNVLTQKQLDDKAEQLREHLNNIIARQTVSDVPVGTFLSGGVDSSIVTAVTRKYIENMSAYSIGFNDRRFDESKYAQRVAEILDVKFIHKIFSKDDFEKVYSLLPELYDEPFADTSAYPTYFVSALARQDVTVVLTGDGGDELFGGYSRCNLMADIDKKKKSSNRILSELYLRFEDVVDELPLTYKSRDDLDCIFKEELALLSKYYLFGKDIYRNDLRKKYKIPWDYDDFWYYRKYYHKDLPPYTRMRYLDFMTYLNGDILTKVDRASMKASLEARVPLLDKEMVEFAFSLTQNECNPGGELKGLLKYAYEDVIPRKIFNRSKQGFSIPFRYIRKGRNPQEAIVENLWGL